MVEGPGCKLKGIKIKAKLKGQSVHAVKGNAVDKGVKKKQPDSVSKFHQLIGLELDDVQTLGKELFIYFGQVCLRVHFLMAGQCFINSQKVDNDFGGKAETATLELQMSRDLVTFRNSSVDIRPAQPCRQKFDNLNDLDICSPVFNFKRAVTLVMEQQGRQVCDVLLDQLILPGVGNIIKNEALFDSGIRPSSKMEELKEEHVTHLIKMTRDFTNIFYMCRRDGKPLYPYYKIYSKRKCKQCEGKVTITRLGDDSERVTYYCDNCQTNDLKKFARKLPKKNSLLGWISTSTEAPLKVDNEWSCTACTLLNPSNQIRCSVCGTPRQTSQSAAVSLNSDSDRTKPRNSASSMTMFNSSSENNALPRAGVKRLSEGASSQPVKKIIVGIDTSSPKLTNIKDLSSRHKHLSGTEGNTKAQPGVSNTVVRGKNSLNSEIFVADCCGAVCCGATAPQQTATRISDSSQNLKVSKVSVERRKSNVNTPLTPVQTATNNSNTSQNLKISQGRSSSQDVHQPGPVPSKIPPCPTHKKRCNMKEVYKKGDNYGRWFFSCVLRTCNFFEWADTRFPLCPDHGKPCTIRTVLKVGPNNGRKFFACKMPKNKQCKFFEWAFGYD